jgi:DNA-binding XRE family transcriptional regulator
MKKDRSRAVAVDLERDTRLEDALPAHPERAEPQTELAGEAEAARRRSANHVRELREALLMSKAELARKSGLSALTIDRVESGLSCRMDTKRKIILALGFKVTDKDKVFGA